MKKWKNGEKIMWMNEFMLFFSYIKVLCKLYVCFDFWDEFCWNKIVVYKKCNNEREMIVYILIIIFYNGVKMLMIGLGVYKVKEGDEVK